jgi:probable O-glycosylation ligase (exosortase A-associated)
MLNLFLTAFVAAFLGAGMKRPFLFVLAYTYIDIVGPQKVTWGFLAHVPVSLIAFTCAFVGWMVADNKDGIRFSPRQLVLLALLIYCGVTTKLADFPVEAADKWAWVWKALVFATFLPLTLRTKLRIEALVLVMVLSVGVIVIGGGIKTLASGGGGYGELKLLVNDNTGLYEGSIISAVAICVIPLALWLARYGTIFKPSWMATLFAWGICFACILMPVGTQARTGLICVAVLGVMMLRSTKRRLTYISLVTIAGLVAVPLLPQSFTERMSTIGNHAADQSASTRLEVWKWTMDYAHAHPFGGGFNAFLQNEVSYETVKADYAGANNAVIQKERIVEKARAYHSSYFEMLGEQGYPGLGLWLLLHVMGVVQMEVLRRRYAKDPPEGFAWVTPLADALQQAQIVYLIGGAFVGIALQPFCYMLVGLQCGLSAYMGRVRRTVPMPFRTVRKTPAPAPSPARLETSA